MAKDRKSSKDTALERTQTPSLFVRIDNPPKSPSAADVLATTSPVVSRAKKLVSSPGWRGGMSRDSGTRKSSLRRTPVASPLTQKPLLPPTARRQSVKEKEIGGDGSRENTPDSALAGREGRQFAVANVGHNGKIYLMPTARPDPQRLAQPAVLAFPMTPPSTAGLEDTAAADESKRWAVKPPDPSQWPLSPPQQTPKPLVSAKPQQPKLASPFRPGNSQRKRAFSDSTVRASIAPGLSDANAFKVYVTRPNEPDRPRTAEATKDTPLLQVDIPTWKLGRPVFLHGSASWRGSSYEVTEPRASDMSMMDHSLSFFSPHTSQLLPAGIDLNAGRLDQLDQRQSARLPTEAKCKARDFTYVIEPSMFDDLTFKPACDAPHLVRYATNTGAVIAATPPRLVAEITSPSFLDYELISDFFLTYRFFLKAQDLLRMLVARLRWAVCREDEVGMVVRVRTFVALRHWVLNYFVDDFAPDHGLRVLFCNLLNDFVAELSHGPKGRKVQVKILAELKKCWRRVCAEYWGGLETDQGAEPDVPITPNGNITGDTDEQPLNRWRNGSHQLEVPPAVPPGSEEILSTLRRESAAHGVPATIPLADWRPRTPSRPEVLLAKGIGSSREERIMTPPSCSSVEATSCAFPGKHNKIFPAQHHLHHHHHGGLPAPHPANASSLAESVLAATPRVPVPAPKRTRHEQSPGHSLHNIRKESVVDPGQEHASTVERANSRGTELVLSIPYGGSLVRGDILPPAQPFVSVSSMTSTLGAASRQTTMLKQPKLTQQSPPPPMPRLPQTRPPPTAKHSAVSAMSGQGMKRLVWSVRRALTTYAHGGGVSHHPSVSSPDVSMQGLYGTEAEGAKRATVHRPPVTPVVPQEPMPTITAPGKPSIRLDILAARIAEDFKKAVASEESATADQSRRRPTVVPKTPEPLETLQQAETLGTVETDHSPRAFDHDKVATTQRATQSSIDYEVVNGQRAVPSVAEEGLVPVNDNSLNGAGLLLDSAGIQSNLESLDVTNSAIDGSIAACIITRGEKEKRALTPPSTPRAVVSRVLAVSGMAPSPPPIQLQSPEDAVPQPLSLGDDDVQSLIPPSVNTTTSAPRRGSMMFGAQHISFVMDRGLNLSPPAPGTECELARHWSPARIFQDDEYYAGHRRYGSYESGISSYNGTRSFDVTTIGSRNSLVADVRMPSPLRVLRRRPGGYLRPSGHNMRLSSRAYSVGSISYTDSVSCDWSLHPDGIPRSSRCHSPLRGEAPVVKRMSLLSEGSARPVRASFELAAQKLRELPDDEDDGGVVAALLKLEGKVPVKKRQLSPLAKRTLGIAVSVFGDGDGDNERRMSDEEVKQENLHQHVILEGLTSAQVPPIIYDEPQVETPLGRSEIKSFLSVATTESECSTFGGARWQEPSKMDDWSNKTVLQSPGERSEKPSPKQRLHTPRGSDVPRSSPPQSFLIMDDTDETDGDDDGHSSAISTEISASLFADDVAKDKNTLLSKRGGAIMTALPINPIEDASPRQLERSPLPAINGHLVTGAADSQVTPVNEHAVGRSFLSPSSISPGHVPQEPQQPPPAPPSPPSLEPRNTTSMEDRKSRYNVHLPFILAFDSDILAQQFTLIEKDALNDIDWKDLLEMKWQSNSDVSKSRSWVDFLRNTEARGVEVVIARFNIMVKWAVSEVVLTKNIEERARCIIKLIHIAGNCRRYRNFATTCQITLALASPELRRLTKTWALVPPEDLAVLRQLETLVSPMRNFYSLRAEMEGGASSSLLESSSSAGPFKAPVVTPVGVNAAAPATSSSSTASHCQRQFSLNAAGPGAEKVPSASAAPATSDTVQVGCIPFIGVYTHDLQFNMQRPSEIPATTLPEPRLSSPPPTSPPSLEPQPSVTSAPLPPLVNFERCRVTANTVKTLLRLTEASSLYTFQSVEGLTERCLWMSALEDDEIRSASDALEN